MELIQWFLMGVLFTLSTIGLAYLSTRVSMPWHGWGLMIVGALAVLFGIGWAGASYLEGVEQSGAMGLVIFSMGGLLLLIAAWRIYIPKDFRL